MESTRAESQPERTRSLSLNPTGSRKALGALVCAIAALLLASPARSKDVAAFVRVNQIGYVGGREGRAYLMTKGAADGCKFTVIDAEGNGVSSGTVSPSTGTWGSFTVYPLDFTIPKPGKYSITVTGAAAAQSPQFKADAASNLYGVALAHALSFYQDQRDGGGFIASGLRKEGSHQNDRTAKVYTTPEFGGREGSQIKGDLVPTGVTVDASGGWWDAGDYLKFVQTTSYVVAMMLIGRRDFPSAMGPASAADFTREARFGLDWLLRMWDDNSRTLYYQVGIGSRVSATENDHSIWRLPQEDDASHGGEAKYRYIRNRPVFIAGPAGSKLSPNLAGRLAGDFALCYQIFHASDRALAERCLVAAEHIFDQADVAPSGHLLTTAPADFYGENEWRDDMEFAATEISLALRGGDLPAGLPHSDSNVYLKSAADWAAQYIQKNGNEFGVLGLADVSSVAHFDLYRAMEGTGSATKLAVTQQDLLRDLRKTLDHAVNEAKSDPFGFGISWGHGDTATQGLALSVMASQYDFLSKAPTFSAYADRWIANVLGANAWGASFIVGDGTTFPHCIHHQVANLVGSHDGGEPILAGAVVEGPLRKPDSGAPHGIVNCPADGADPFEMFNGNSATYRDNSKFYSTNEPAIDLTAPSFLALSWQIAGAPSVLVTDDH